MAFTVNIETSGSAFDGETRGFETATILRKLADQAEEGYQEFFISDSNGNRVGFAEFSEEDNN